MAQNSCLIPMETQLYSMQRTVVSRSWILFDIKGEGTILDLDKYDILRRIPIHARDLRILDPVLSYPSTILCRDKAIILNLEHIKAIITAKEVLLRDPLDDNVLPVVEEMHKRLSMAIIDHNEEENDERPEMQNDVDIEEHYEFPFEFIALEVALEGICSYLNARITKLEITAYPALDELTSKVRTMEDLEKKFEISSGNLDRARKLKSSMSKLCIRVQRVKDELEQLLEDDDGIADLFLTRKMVDHSPVSITSKNSTPLSSHGKYDVEELEMLLETYFMQIGSAMNKLTTLREYIDDTEDYINIQVDNYRNQLIQLKLFLSSGNVCLSVCSMVTAIFCMNIPFTWWKGGPSYAYMFKWVVLLTGMMCASIFITIVSYARHKGLVGSW